MAYCTNCGTMVPDDAAFCQKCGQPQKPVATAAPVQSRLSENTAALLSYILGWLTGVIFLLIDKRPYVRFHAAQSVITFGALHIIRAILGVMFGFGWWFSGARHVVIGSPLLSLLGLLTFALWIICMVKAYQGQWFKLPLAGDLAEDIVGRQPRSRVGS